jgi:nitrite reductase (cytochrome c-552)
LPPPVSPWLLLALLTNIFERKQEARQPFVRMVEVTEDTMDPKGVGVRTGRPSTTPILKTSLPTATKYGGRGLGASAGGPAEQKLDRDPWLRPHLRRLRLRDRLS